MKKTLGCPHGRPSPQGCPHCMGIGAGSNIAVCPKCAGVMIQDVKRGLVCYDCDKAAKDPLITKAVQKAKETERQSVSVKVARLLNDVYGAKYGTKNRAELISRLQDITL